jgi:hypothetical protein
VSAKPAPVVIDPVAAAERVARNPRREALRVSTLETVAMAMRLLALEDVAADTAQLLDRCETAQTFTADGPTAREYAAGTRELMGTIASALAALGYATTEEATEEKETVQ